MYQVVITKISDTVAEDFPFKGKTNWEIKSISGESDADLSNRFEANEYTGMRLFEKCGIATEEIDLFDLMRTEKFHQKLGSSENLTFKVQIQILHFQEAYFFT